MKKEFFKIQDFFITEYPLNHEGLNELLNLFEIQTFIKGDQILSQGKAEKYLRFLNSGVVREYYATPEKENKYQFLY